MLIDLNHIFKKGEKQKKKKLDKEKRMIKFKDGVWQQGSCNP